MGDLVPANPDQPERKKDFNISYGFKSPCKAKAMNTESSLTGSYLYASFLKPYHEGWWRCLWQLEL